MEDGEPEPVAQATIYKWILHARYWGVLRNDRLGLAEDVGAAVAQTLGPFKRKLFQLVIRTSKERFGLSLDALKTPLGDLVLASGDKRPNIDKLAQSIGEACKQGAV